MKERLSELAEIDAGYTFRSSLEHDPEGSYWVLRPSDINGQGRIAWNEVTKIPDVDPSKQYVLDERTVLFVTYGRENRAYYLQGLPSRVIAESGFTLIRPRPGTEKRFDPAYLAWYMNQPPARAFYEAFRRSSTTSKISRKSLGALTVPLPPDEVQESVGTIDQLSRKEAQLIDELLEKRRYRTDRSLLELVAEHV